MKPLEEIRLLVRELKNEDVAARPIAERMKANPHAPLPEECITLGMVHELIAAAFELLEQSPATSELLAQRATEVAAALDENAYARVLRVQAGVQAWKELANAKRYRSDCEGSLRALDTARAIIEDEVALAHDRAILALARATTLREMNRIPEALQCLRFAKPILEDHTDSRRVAQCQLLEGMIRHGQGDRTAAVTAYRGAIATAHASGDSQIIASAYTNLGVLDAEHGLTNGALDALQQARAIFEDRRAFAEVARANWGIGLALLTASRFEAAIPLLREARRVFRTVGMNEEAGLAGVELAEAYLALDRHTAAQRLILVVIDEFRAASLNERALVALAYLRDLGPAARRESAHHVYLYLSRLRREPLLLFLPPEQ